MFYMVFLRTKRNYKVGVLLFCIIYPFLFREDLPPRVCCTD